MTNGQVKNTKNPLAQLDNYTSVYVVDNKEIENIMLPANPLKQKRYMAWSKTEDEKKRILNFIIYMGKSK